MALNESAYGASSRPVRQRACHRMYISDSSRERRVGSARTPCCRGESCSMSGREFSHTTARRGRGCCCNSRKATQPPNVARAVSLR